MEQSSVKSTSSVSVPASTVSNLGVISDIPDRGGKCQKPKDVKSPPQAHRITNLLSGSQASGTPLALHCDMCRNAWWQQSLMGSLCCIFTTHPGSCMLSWCGHCQDKYRVTAAPCFSIDLAHLLLFILISVQKTTSVFCSEEDDCSEHHQPASSAAPAAPLGASAALCNPCSSLFLWICEF